MAYQAESERDQVGDALRAKHAGSRVVPPSARAALCHLVKLARVFALSGLSCQENLRWGADTTRPHSMMSDEHREWSRVPCNKTDWKAPGGIRERWETEGHTWSLACELSFSRLPWQFYTPSSSASSLVRKPCLFTHPLDSEVLKWQEAMSAHLFFYLFILPLLSLRTLAFCCFFLLSELYRQGYVQSYSRCWDFQGFKTSLTWQKCGKRGKKDGWQRTTSDTFKWCAMATEETWQLVWVE